jgi:hypothetical protein
MRNTGVFRSNRQGGVTRDPIYLFNISTAAKFLRNTSKNFDILTKNFAFLQFSGSFQATVTVWRFDIGSSDARPRPKFVIDWGVRDA